MSTPDFFRSRLDAMIDLQHPLAVLARRLPWDRIEQALAPKFAHRDRADRRLIVDDLLGQHQVEFGGGVSNAGRPRLSIRLMASLLYLKNAFNQAALAIPMRQGWRQRCFDLRPGHLARQHRHPLAVLARRLPWDRIDGRDQLPPIEHSVVRAGRLDPHQQITDLAPHR